MRDAFPVNFTRADLDGQVVTNEPHRRYPSLGFRTKEIPPPSPTGRKRHLDEVCVFESYLQNLERTNQRQKGKAHDNDE